MNSVNPYTVLYALLYTVPVLHTGDLLRHRGTLHKQGSVTESHSCVIVFFLSFLAARLKLNIIVVRACGHALELMQNGIR